MSIGGYRNNGGGATVTWGMQWRSQGLQSGYIVGTEGVVVVPLYYGALLSENL